MFTVSLTIDDVIDALANYIRPFVNDITIIRAQVNRVPEPLGEFVLLTEMGQYEIETPTVTYDEGTSSSTVNNPSRIGVQVDIYGENSGDYCRAILSSFRTTYAYDNFPDGIKPLYCSDGRQMPLTNAEMQYQSRWTITAFMQYNPLVMLPQDFPDELETNLFVNVDTNIE
jgi:hypothetical protein